jgi:hypothetical protein
MVPQSFRHIRLFIGLGVELRSLAACMNQPMAIPTNRLQILRPMGPAVRPERAVMDLQPITAAAVDTSPPVSLQNPVAMQPVNRVHQPNQGHSFAPVLGFHDKNVSGKGAEPEAASAVWNRPYVVACQHLCLSSGYNGYPALRRLDNAAELAFTGTAECAVAPAAGQRSAVGQVETLPDSLHHGIQDFGGTNVLVADDVGL